MRIQLTKAGKRYNRDWIFKNADITFIAGETYAITGSNGSGKSTLLQILAGSVALSSGTIEWQHLATNIDTENIYASLSIAAPYVEVIEEMTALEFLHFHFKFKPCLKEVSPKEILSIVGLENAVSKQIRHYSSGMKQRIKLAQAIFSDVPLLLLDEPCTNLDQKGYELYHNLIATFAKNKTVIVSSNDVNEYSFCKHITNIMDFK